MSGASPRELRGVRDTAEQSRILALEELLLRPELDAQEIGWRALAISDNEGVEPEGIELPPDERRYVASLRQRFRRVQRLARAVTVLYYATNAALWRREESRARWRRGGRAVIRYDRDGLGGLVRDGFVGRDPRLDALHERDHLVLLLGSESNFKSSVTAAAVDFRDADSDRGLAPVPVDVLDPWAADGLDHESRHSHCGPSLVTADSTA
jgi:hypothetical protein